MKKIINIFKQPKEVNLRMFMLQTFNVKPKNIGLYQQAFTHKSISKEKSNERLEFLGDSILSSVIASFLYQKYPIKTEGELSKLTSKIVNRSHLNKLGKKLELNQFINVVNHQNGHKNILGNTLEAVIGAIYLDLGYEQAKQVILKRIVNKHISLSDLDNQDEDYKSQLLIWGQKNKKKIEFKTKKLYQTEIFEVTLKIDGKERVSAKGGSKKTAENKAAKRAMELFPTITPN